MRFGFCAPIREASALAAIGYDYIEPPVVSALDPESSEDAFENALERLGGVPLPTEAFNVFLPGALKITGPDTDPARQERYLERAIPRAARLGGKVIVLGSAGSRSVPDGFSSQRAREQIAVFLALAAPIAAAHGIHVALEPLNRGECNIVNSVGEAMDLVRAANHPNIAVLSDLYHVRAEQQSYDETRDAGAHLMHVHVAGSVGRRIPATDDIPILAAYFRVLKEMGYAGRISIESASADRLNEAQTGLETLRAAWAAA